MADYPTDLRYTERHQWLRPRDRYVTLGITEVAVERLGAAVGFVELPYPGELFRADDVFGRMTAGDASLALRMPFVAQVNSVNDALGDAPSRISEDPYGEGWIARLEPGDPALLEGLMDAEAYAAFVEGEA